MAEKLGVAVHGAGWVAGEHIKAYIGNPNTEVRVVNSRREESARRKRDETGLDCDISTSYDEVLARADVDIISICTPNDLHPDETVKAADAGKHILIEKPVAIDLDNLMRMAAGVEKAGVKTVVSFVLRWNPLVKTLKAMVEDGAFGDIFYAETDYWHNIGDWYPGYKWAITKAQGGSAMLFGGCHALDTLRWLAGDVAEVSAYSCKGSNNEYEYDTTCVASLKLANGGVGKVSASFEGQLPYRFNIDLLGTKGTARNNTIYSDKFPGQTDFATIPTVLPDSGEVEHHEFQQEIDHFVDCILNDVESHVNLADAVKTHQVCLAIDQSAAEGGQPVKLPLA